MLQRQDYILRLIEQMGRVLAGFVDRILNRAPDELGDVEAELNGMAHKVGLDLELARRLEPGSLHIMIASGGDVDPGRCWLLAELLFLHGLQAQRRGEPDSALESFTRSLHLYRLVQPGWASAVPLPDAEARRIELQERIQALGGPEPEA